MEKTTKIVLIVFLTAIVVYGVTHFLVIIIMSPSFGSANVKNIIQIYSDEDFENYDFTGTGASNNPYIIENRILGANTTGVKRWYYGLDVANTTKNFIVQNCTFFGGINAIRMENVAEGTVIIRTIISMLFGSMSGMSLRVMQELK